MVHEGVVHVASLQITVRITRRLLCADCCVQIGPTLTPSGARPPVQKLFKSSCYTVTVLFLDLLKVDGSYMVVAVKNVCEKRDASRCDLSHHRGGSSDCNTVTV